MAAWGHAGMAAVPAEITEEKLQEKGKLSLNLDGSIVNSSSSLSHDHEVRSTS